jgi:hypothetical protein
VALCNPESQRRDRAHIAGSVDERELSLAVVGIDFPNTDRRKTDRRFEMLLCAPGDPVTLVLEPKNPHDEHAVAVYSSRGIQLGYLKSERAVFVGAKIRAGESYEVVFQEAAPSIGVIRIRFGGGAPTLPPPRPVDIPTNRPNGDDDSGFYPDPDGPEWGA